MTSVADPGIVPSEFGPTGKVYPFAIATAFTVNDVGCAIIPDLFQPNVISSLGAILKNDVES